MHCGQCFCNRVIGTYKKSIVRVPADDILHFFVAVPDIEVGTPQVQAVKRLAYGRSDKLNHSVANRVLIDATLQGSDHVLHWQPRWNQRGVEKYGSAVGDYSLFKISQGIIGIGRLKSDLQCFGAQGIVQQYHAAVERTGQIRE